MKAPEKIYLVNDDLNIKREWYKTQQVGFETTEYTCTDAFINKACRWIRNNSHNYANNALGKEYLVNDFKNYMKEK